MSELREKIANLIGYNCDSCEQMECEGEDSKCTVKMDIASQILALIQPEPQSPKSSCCVCGHGKENHLLSGDDYCPNQNCCLLPDCKCIEFNPCSIQPQELIRDEEIEQLPAVKMLISREEIDRKGCTKLHSELDNKFNGSYVSSQCLRDALYVANQVKIAQLHHCKTVLFPKWFEEEVKRRGLIK
jgi:hypothetical protein